MAGINAVPDSGGYGGPVAAPDCGGSDPAQVVDEVLDAYVSGDATRVLLEALGECCSPEQAQAILAELQRREPDDWQTIVNTSAIAGLQGGDYSRAGLAMLADAIALGHADGSIGEDDLFAIFGSGLSGDGAQEIGAQMLFGASDSQAMQDFEQAMASAAMDVLAGADRRDASHGTDVTTTGWANVVVSGLGVDAASRQALQAAYADPARDAAEREHIRELLSDKDSVGYGHGGNPDALAGLITAVSEAVDPVAADGTDLAVEMANWAGDNQEHFAENDIFGSRVSDPRSEALALLLVRHGDAILGDLTDGYENPEQFATDDAKRLGFLLGITAFNGENLFGASAQAVLDRYIDRQAAIVGADPTSAEAQVALGRLEILSPSLLIAQALPTLGNLESNEARVDGLLRIIDTVVAVGSLVPTGRFASFLIDAYGTVEGLSDGQIERALEDYLTQLLSGSPEEIEAGLAELAAMVDDTVQAAYADNPVVAGAMSRRLEDTLYDILVAIADNDVAGYLETHGDG